MDLPVKVRIFGDDKSFRLQEMSFWKNWLLFIFLKLDKIILFIKTSISLIQNRELENFKECWKYGVPYEEINYFYDKKENLIETKYGETKTFYKYDSNGNITEIKTFGRAEILTHAKFHFYEYDSKSNWVKRKSNYKYLTGKSGVFLEQRMEIRREIIYF